MKTLVLASNNAGKLREFSTLLAPLDWEVRPQADFQVSEVAEPHPTFIENALTKARHAAQHTGLPALADDSGICVPALNGAPGVHSARFAGLPKSDVRNNTQLIELLKAHTDRRAYYVCVLVFLRHANDPQPLIAQATWWGEMVEEPKGENGFGYDPYFFLPTLGCTAAQLSAAQKNQLSHRGQALRCLLQALQALAA